jgi:hypothetical protein
MAVNLNKEISKIAAYLGDQSQKQMGIPGNPLWTRDFLLEVAKGNIPGHSVVHKFGRNPNIPNAVGTFETIWNGGGVYTGHNAVAAEILEVFSSSGNDIGTLVSSGTATGGSTTTMEDTGATFSSDGVAAGDVLINDTQSDHGIIVSVTETIITVWRFEGSTAIAVNDAYRVATKASTGTPVIKLRHLLNSSYVDVGGEYIITNGVTGVDTVGAYLRMSRARCHGGDNVGEITCRQKTTTANIMMALPIGYNSTMICADTIPAGKTGHFITWFGSLSGKVNANCSLRLKVRPVGDVFQVQEEASVMSSGNSALPRVYPIPKGGFKEMNDITIEADSDTNSTGIAAGWAMLYVDN